MSISLSPPFYGGDVDGFTTHIPPPYYDGSYSSQSSPSPSSTSTSTAIVIVVIIIASAVIITASIYLLLRFLSKRFHRSFRTFTAADDVVLHGSDGASNQQQCHVASSNLLESLPLFTFGSVKGNLTGADCAVCLSKFEPHDQLRLLPLCCHAFHAQCIDAWIVSNMTCPLCRSTVLPSDADIDKILSSENRGNGYNNPRDDNGGSFRIEIGSISRRGSEMEVVDGERRSRSRSRSFSIGSFEYIVDENGYEVSVGSIAHSRGVSGSVDKDSPGEVLAADVAGSRNWLREYVDRLASVSFRSSGRFFSGSSRRTDPVIAAEDLEANRVGEEISELFRWLSGV